MQTYLSLLASSKKGATLEACCGALQNLTANKGMVSTKKIIIRLSNVCVVSTDIQNDLRWTREKGEATETEMWWE